MIFDQFPYLRDEDIQAFQDRTSAVTYEKSAHLVREGTVCKKVFLIVSGLVRTYYHTELGEENTYCITFPGSFITAYTSFITQTATIENIQAVEKSEVIEVSLDTIREVSENNIRWMRFLKDMAEYQYMELEKRLFTIQNISAADRYEQLLDEHPEYILKLPASYISSYLGITGRHFNRIRKNLRTNVL